MAVPSGQSVRNRRGSRMVTIHDHASSTTVTLYGINGSINMCRSSSSTARGDRLRGLGEAEQRGGADAAV